MTTPNPRSRGGRLRSLLIAPVVGIALGAGGILPLSAALAHAGDNDYTQWEDCDWDGYDDHTGVKVPWPGFDGTKGDTPSGPSDASQTGKKQASASASPTPARPSSDSSSGASSGNTSSKASPGKKTNPGKKADPKPSATTTAKARPTASASPTAKASHQPSVTPTPSESPETGPATLSLQGDGRVTAGASLTISGAGFEPGQDGLSISLQSVPGELASVTADASGGFEATVQLPGDAPAGAQTLSVTHDGAQVTSLGLDVAGSVAVVTANSPAPAGIDEATVGVALLAGLAVSGGGAVAASSLIRRRRRQR